jgi:hypothetical protein
MILTLRDLHGEFARAEHGAIRVLVESIVAVKKMSRGVDGAVFAAYDLAQQYCENAFARGFVWYDCVPIRSPTSKCGVLANFKTHTTHTTRNTREKNKIHISLRKMTLSPARNVLEDTSHQIRPKIDAGDASLLMGSIN